MLQSIEDFTLDEETQDVEFMLYGGENRMFTVHKNNTIKLWHLPLANGELESRVYRVFICEGTVRNVCVVKYHDNELMKYQGDDNEFLTCEFTDKGNQVNVWNIEFAMCTKLKGPSRSYMGSTVRICAAIYLSQHILAVLISDEGIVHSIDIWNTETNLCIHRDVYRAYLPVQNIYNIHGYLIVQPWSSMAEIIVWKVKQDTYHKMDKGNLLTAPPSNIASYRCIISEETGHIIAGGTQLKMFRVTRGGKIKYLCSVQLDPSSKLFDLMVLHSGVHRLLLIDNTVGLNIYNTAVQRYKKIHCHFKHRNKDILVRSDSGFTYRPYLFLPDNGVVIVQDIYANMFYKYLLPIDCYVPKHYAEIRKNARVLYQVYENDRFLLPAEMWLNILTYTGYVYDRSWARKVANMYFCKPQIDK